MDKCEGCIWSTVNRISSVLYGFGSRTADQPASIDQGEAYIPFLAAHSFGPLGIAHGDGGLAQSRQSWQSPVSVTHWGGDLALTTQQYQKVMLPNTGCLGLATV